MERSTDSCFDRRVKNRLIIAVLAVALASGCKKQEDAGAGSGTATATGSGSATGSAVAAAVDAAAAAAVDAAAPSDNGFAAIFDPINSKLDHVSRARTACEQRPALLEAAKAIDKGEAVLRAIDEMGDPCDAGDIKGIEAKLDEAKKALDALSK